MTTAQYPAGFFDRADPSDDAAFYAEPRLLTHIDDRAIAAVGALYEQLGLAGTAVIDLMSSWVSHFKQGAEPAELAVLGMNADELAANPLATRTVLHDLHTDPALPFPDESFDHATCCVSVDYLTQPVTVFREVARVLRPGGLFVVTFSNRLFPTKAIRGWLSTDSIGHCRIVESYFANAGGFDAPTTQLRTTMTEPGDPLFAVFARRSA